MKCSMSKIQRCDTDFGKVCSVCSGPAYPAKCMPQCKTIEMSRTTGHVVAWKSPKV